MLFLFLFSLELKPSDGLVVLEKLKQAVALAVLKLNSVTDDKDQLLSVVVEAIAQWATLMELANKIIVQLQGTDLDQYAQELILQKKKVGKVKKTPPPPKKNRRMVSSINFI